MKYLIYFLCTIILIGCDFSPNSLTNKLENDQSLVWVEYLDNQKLSQMQILDKESGDRYILNFDDPSLVNLSKYKNSILNGKSYIFRKNGTLWSMENYSNGNRNRETIVYDSIGQIDIINHYHENKTWAKQTIDSLLDIHPVINHKPHKDYTTISFSFPYAIEGLGNHTMGLRHSLSPLELYKKNMGPLEDTLISNNAIIYDYNLRKEHDYIIFGYLYKVNEDNSFMNYSLFRDTIRL